MRASGRIKKVSKEKVRISDIIGGSQSIIEGGLVPQKGNIPKAWPGFQNMYEILGSGDSLRRDREGPIALGVQASHGNLFITVFRLATRNLKLVTILEKNFSEALQAPLRHLRTSEAL